VRKAEVDRGCRSQPVQRVAGEIDVERSQVVAQLSGAARSPRWDGTDGERESTQARACGVRILGQVRDLGVVRGLPDDGVLKMNAFKRGDTCS
jgi:hypothetical protein